MSAARVIDLQAVRAKREERRTSTPTLARRIVWMPMVVWVPLPSQYIWA